MCGDLPWRRVPDGYWAPWQPVIRVTWAQLLNEPFAVVARIAQAIISRAA
jgi:hypothetical protein